MGEKADFRVACDVGGTFTDVAVLSADGRLALFKTPTTVDDQGLSGILTGIELASAELAAPGPALPSVMSVFVHATTRPLNAILERKTARTAFLTTNGHPDILYLREGGRTSFRHHTPYPEPYISRSLTFEIDERVGPEGQIIRPLDEEAARVVLQRVKDADVEAIAVCLLWAIVNPAHEEQLGRLIEEELPEVPYSLSHRVNPIIREYRRASATAIDASLKPLMSDYLATLHESLARRGFEGEILCASCTGTMLPLDDVAASPVHAVQSGPALAPLAAMKIAERTADAQAASEALIVVDVGGTSSDVTVIDAEVLPLTSELWLGERFAGHILGLPAVEVKSIGAGGGSIAWIDSGGLLRVGPKSAGAVPGPACYGAGGVEPTLTDAAVTLGYLNPLYFLGGRKSLDAALATKAIEDRVARALDIDAAIAADAIMAVSTQQMTDAIEEITVNRGLDPREALVVAGGGAAGFVIDAIARGFGGCPVLIPRAAPALAACGGTFVPLARDFRGTFVTDSRSFDLDGVNDTLDRLAREAQAFLDSRARDRGRSEITGYVDARYAHQRWEIAVPLERLRFESPDDVDALVERFHALHARLFGVKDPDQHVECISWRIRATNYVSVGPWMMGGDLTAMAREGSRSAFYRGHGWLTATVVGGAVLKPGLLVEGPALIEEPATTIVVSPGSTLEVLATGDLRLDVSGAEK
jgi:N-methylhydantoinase A